MRGRIKTRNFPLWASKVNCIKNAEAVSTNYFVCLSGLWIVYTLLSGKRPSVSTVSSLSAYRSSSDHFSCWSVKEKFALVKGSPVGLFHFNWSCPERSHLMHICPLVRLRELPIIKIVDSLKCKSILLMFHSLMYSILIILTCLQLNDLS